MKIKRQGNLSKYRHPRFAVYTVIILFLVLLFYNLPYQTVIVSGPSMEPTLHYGQVVVFDKTNKNPKINDIIMFRHGHDILIKRLIATNETIKWAINGNVSYPDIIRKRTHNPAEQAREMIYFIDQMRKEPRVKCIELMPDDLWVEGDNVDQSEDSRIFGPIKRKDVIGILIAGSS